MDALKGFRGTDFNVITDSTTHINTYLDLLRSEIAGLPMGSNRRNAKVLILGEKEILLSWIDFYNNVKYIADTNMTTPTDAVTSNSSLYRYYNTVLLPLMTAG